MTRRSAPIPQGLTLIELLVSITVLGILASVAMPLVQVSVTRTRELELRRSLRTVGRQPPRGLGVGGCDPDPPGRAGPWR